MITIRCVTSITFGIPPADLKIWMFKNAETSSAPMLRRVNQFIGHNDHSDVLNYFINIGYGSLATLLNRVLKSYLPDITIGTKGCSYNDIYRTVNHELAHSSHFAQVGDGFWAKYISYIMTYGAYGNGEGKNAELCAIGEMWGYSMGNIQVGEYNNKTIDRQGVVDGWIKPDVFRELYTSKLLTKKQIFDCLTPSVDTYDELIIRMTRMYPRKAEAIKSAFYDYKFSIPTIDLYKCPKVDSVKFGEEFEILWRLVEDSTQRDIEFRLLKEKYFDGSSYRNIRIDKVDTNKAIITIHKPGYYIVEANAVGTGISKYYHIAKHYRPEFSLPHSEMSGGTEPVKELGTKIEGARSSSVTIGSKDYVEERVVALTQVNYSQATTAIPAKRIDLRLVYAESDTLKLNYGEPSTVVLPELYDYIYEREEYDPEDTDIETHPEYIKYTTISRGYYTMSYPDDVSKWSDNY